MSEADRTGPGPQDMTAFLESILQNLPHMVFVKEAAELRFVMFNKAGEALLGLPSSALLGKNDFDFFPKDQAEAFQAKDREVLRGNEIVSIPEEPIDTVNGRRWLSTKKIPIRDADGNPRFLLGISEDITERKSLADELAVARRELEQRVQERTAELRESNEKLACEIEEKRQAEAALRASEEQLRQAQKMEAIGRLAGGIAHDFNNLLSVILGYSDLMLEQTGGRLQEDLLEIRRAGVRARALTQQLLAFSRRQVLEPRVVDINEVIAGMSTMLGRVIGEDIELRTVRDPRLYHVLVDPSQIEQVILNLAVNARDAMPRGGTLTLETANVELDGEFADSRGLKPGPHALLAVTDTGTGMDSATVARVFDPFFTTKEVGKGTGLGLATVFGIVKQSGGHVWVYSEPGRGASFKVYLPRAEGATATEAPPPRPIANGTETVLLVEDDQQVRALGRSILEQRGYRVLDAPNGPRALELSESFAEHIDLLVTDVVMPTMGGRELATRLTASRPSLKVLFTSGYTDDTVVHHGVLEAGVAFLQKPITPDSLARRVRELLDAVSADPPSGRGLSFE